MATDVKIAGAFRSPVANNLRINWQLKGRGSCEIGIYDDQDDRPLVGQVIEVYIAGPCVWRGTVESIRDMLVPGTGGNWYTVTGVTLEQRLDLRLITPYRNPGDPVSVFSYRRFSADPATDTLDTSAHATHIWQNGDAVMVKSDGTLPAGLAAETVYYVINRSDNGLQLAATAGGPAIDITDAGTGTHKLIWCAGTIVKYLVEHFANGENLTTTNVQPGAGVEKVLYDHAQLAGALSQLAELSGYSWWVDPDADVHFADPTTGAAPFEITDVSNNIRNLTVNRSRTDYYNMGYLRMAWEGVALETESQVGDESKRIFALDHPAGIVEGVQVDGVDQTFGADGSTGNAWYWYPGENLIEQDASGAILTAGNTLTVKYRRLGEDIVSSRNWVEVAARQGIEGRSGKYEFIVESTDQKSWDAAQSQIDALTAAYSSSTPLTIEFESDPWIEATISTLKVGQYIPATRADLGIGGNYIVDSISAWDEAGEVIRYSVSAHLGNQISALESLKRWFTGGGGGGGISSVSGAVSASAGRDFLARLIFWYPEGQPIDIADDVSDNHRRTREAVTGEKVQLISAVVETKEAVDGDLVFDVSVSSDHGATWTTIFGASKPTADDGTTTGTPVTTFTVPYLLPDDLLTLDVLAIGNNTTVSGEVTLFGRVIAA